MLYPAPAHIRHVQEPVDAADIHEGAEVGDVLHFAVKNRAHRDSLQEALLLVRPVLFEQLAAAHHHVPAASRELDDLQLHALADVSFEIPGGAERELAGRHECVDADIHLESALHPAGNDAFNDAIILIDLLDMLPVLDPVRFDLRQDRHALLVLGFLDVEIELRLYFQLIRLHELRQLHDALALVPDINEDPVVANLDDHS